MYFLVDGNFEVNIVLFLNMYEFGNLSVYKFLFFIENSDLVLGRSDIILVFEVKLYYYLFFNDF